MLDRLSNSEEPACGMAHQLIGAVVNGGWQHVTGVVGQLVPFGLAQAVDDGLSELLLFGRQSFVVAHILTPLDNASVTT